VRDREALAATVGGDGIDREQQLPAADVEDAIAARVDQGEDRGGDGHADAAQARQ
jgi:hypothetical protein